MRNEAVVAYYEITFPFETTEETKKTLSQMLAFRPRYEHVTSPE
jgi:hypothetical protein